MGLDEGLPSPPWRKPRCSTVRQFLHGVFVASCDPFIDHDIRVHRERACVSFPGLGGRVVLPALGDATEGPPDLPSLDALLAESAIIERLGALLETRRRDEGVDHFVRV